MGLLNWTTEFGPERVNKTVGNQMNARLMFAACSASFLLLLMVVIKLNKKRHALWRADVFMRIQFETILIIFAPSPNSSACFLFFSPLHAGLKNRRTSDCS